MPYQFKREPLTQDEATRLANACTTLSELGRSKAGTMAKKLSRVDDGVYPGLISRFERGLAEPSLLVLLEYSRLVRVPLEALVDDKLELITRSQS